MVAFARVVELREARCVGTPIEFSAINYYSSDCGAMATYPFGCAVDHYVGAVVNRTAEIAARAEGIVDYDRDTVLVCDFCNGFEVWDVIAGVPDGFEVYGFGFFVNESVKVGGGVSFDEFGGYAEAGKGDFELVVGAAVEIGGRDYVVACVGKSGNGHKLGGLAGGGCNGCDAAFEGCNSLFKHIDCGLEDCRY